MIRIVKIAPNYGEPFYADQKPRFLRSPLYLCNEDPADQDIIKFPDRISLLKELTVNYIRLPGSWVPLKLENYDYELLFSVGCCVF
jgi:hypothetical protein